jgi:mutator protein MutT
VEEERVEKETVTFFRLVTVTAAVIERDGVLLLTRRLEGTHLAGAWEFPGGKCEPGETLEESLRRELLEELGVNVDIGEEIFTATHAYPTRTVELHFFACRLRGEPHPRLGQEMRWVAPAELPGLAFPEADAELVAALAAGRLVLSAPWPEPGSPQDP